LEHTPELSVVVPVHDEVDNVIPLAQEVGDALEGRIDYELIFVDDGSTDGTATRLQQLIASPTRVRVCRQRPRCGQSAALWTGARCARARWIATLDGDGQNAPQDIPRLYQAARTISGDGSCVMIVGRRVRRQDPLPKRLGSKIANAVRCRFLGDGTPDTGCGLKVFSRESFLGLPYFDHMHRFLPALVLRGGGRVVSMDVQHRPRLAGRTKYGLLDRLGVGLVDLWGVWWLQRRIRRPEVEELSCGASQSVRNGGETNELGD
jgi:dolichol-phosphate mannosyltransferase